jgi:hypothetical protein
MYAEAELVFRSYIPEKLEIGMLFITTLEKGKHSYPIVYSLNYIPQDEEEYLRLNGYPVKPYIVDKGNPNVDVEEVLATPEQIGWLDEGDDTDELRDIEIKDMNIILKDYEGWLDVEMEELVDEEGNEYMQPLIYADKVTIRFFQEEEEWEFEEEEESLMDDDIEKDDFIN